jgi:hypothetical protein
MGHRDDTTIVDVNVTSVTSAGRREIIDIPRPTVWPAACALGITFALFGLIMTIWISLIGFALLALAIIGWIREIIHESGQSHS